jgi:TRAP-type mannitol/chloroaromatic compound transport system permease large subunit
MTAFLIHNMAPIMFASLVVFLLLGYPVAGGGGGPRGRF